MLPPKLGLLSCAADMLFSGSVSEVLFIPISISYDRVLEAETFPQELLGEPKKAEVSSRRQTLKKGFAPRPLDAAAPAARGLGMAAALSLSRAWGVRLFALQRVAKPCFRVCRAGLELFGLNWFFSGLERPLLRC